MSTPYIILSFGRFPLTAIVFVFLLGACTINKIPGGGVSIKPWPEDAPAPPATTKAEAPAKKATIESKVAVDEKVEKTPPKPVEKPFFKPSHRPAPPQIKQPPLAATPQIPPQDKPAPKHDPEGGGIPKEPQMASLPPVMSAKECRSLNESFGTDYEDVFTRGQKLSDALIRNLLNSLGVKVETLWFQCVHKIIRPRRLSMQRSFVLFFLEDFVSSLESFKHSLSLPKKPRPLGAPASKREQLLRAFKVILRDCADQKKSLRKLKAAQLYYQREMYEAARTVFTELKEVYGLMCRPLKNYAADQLALIRDLTGH